MFCFSADQVIDEENIEDTVVNMEEADASVRRSLRKKKSRRDNIYLYNYD
jgi:hypothetical protein